MQEIVGLVVVSKKSFLYGNRTFLLGLQEQPLNIKERFPNLLMYVSDHCECPAPSAGQSAALTQSTLVKCSYNSRPWHSHIFSKPIKNYKNHIQNLLLPLYLFSGCVGVCMCVCEPIPGCWSARRPVRSCRPNWLRWAKQTQTCTNIHNVCHIICNIHACTCQITR